MSENGARSTVTVSSAAGELLVVLAAVVLVCVVVVVVSVGAVVAGDVEVVVSVPGEQAARMETRTATVTAGRFLRMNPDYGA